jgi:hypothetical protein
LNELGFSVDDLRLCTAHGMPPQEVYESVERLMEMGLTTERYAKETFAEAYPEMFEEVALEENVKEVELKYNGNDKPKPVIENFLLVMQKDRRYANIKFNELGNRAEVHKVEEYGKVLGMILS